jgi:hypothetical protein
MAPHVAFLIALLSFVLVDSFRFSKSVLVQSKLMGRMVNGGGKSRNGRSNYGRSSGRSAPSWGEDDIIGGSLSAFTDIRVIDPTRTSPVSSIGLSSPSLEAVLAKGFSVLTPVQSQVFDYVKSGGDAVVRSRTGTGEPLLRLNHYST